jgi:predicted AAA+ superfamily ATPase
MRHASICSTPRPCGNIPASRKSSSQLSRPTLTHGLLPVLWAAADAEEILQAYNGLYLREEVQMEDVVRNAGDFARFVESTGFSQASVLNLANVARESHTNRKTVENYLQILEDLLLASASKCSPRGPNARDKRMPIDGVPCMPCEEFLRALRPDSFPE